MKWGGQAKPNTIWSPSTLRKQFGSTLRQLGLEQWMTAGMFVGVAGPAQRTGGGWGELGLHWAGGVGTG